jgi:hypothetical protein
LQRVVLCAKERTRKQKARYCGLYFRILASPRRLLGIHFVHVVVLRLSLGPPHAASLRASRFTEPGFTKGFSSHLIPPNKNATQVVAFFLASPRGLLGIHFVHVLALRLSLGPPHAASLRASRFTEPGFTKGFSSHLIPPNKNATQVVAFLLASPRGFEPLLQP